MKTITFRLAYALVLAAAVALAAGCGAVREERTPDGRVVLEWYNYATPEFLTLYREELIPAFERSHPHIKIRLNASLGDTGYDSKLLTLIAGGIAPDVIHVTQANFPLYAAKGLLVDVRTLAKDDPDFSEGDYFKPVLDSMRRGDRLYGLPSDFSTILLFYNKRIFDEAGLPYPDASWTWDTFLQASRKLTVDEDGDRAPDQFAFVTQNAYNRWPAWVWMNGGELFNRDETICLMDSPEAIGGFSFFVELATKWNVAPAVGQSTGQSPEELFMAEKIAMCANSRYAYKSFAKGMSFPWDVAPMPKGTQRATTLIWGANCILTSTKHPKECWEFLKFLSGREGALGNVRMGNAIPAYKPVALTPGMLKTDVSPANDDEFLRAVSHARTAAFPPQFADYTQALSELDDAFLGVQTPEGVCRRFARRVNVILKEAP